jgi:hypothetical protein
MLFMKRHVLSCVQALDKALAALQGGSPSAAREVEALLAEVEALLSYWNDILCTSAPFSGLNVFPAVLEMCQF